MRHRFSPWHLLFSVLTFVIPFSGFAQNVGIGTAAPDSRLHVVDIVSANSAIMLENTHLAAGMEFEGQGAPNGEGIFQIGVHTARGITERGTNPHAAWMRIDTRPTTESFGWWWESAGSNSEDLLMTLLPTGQLGIGTSGPTQRLDVDG